MTIRASIEFMEAPAPIMERVTKFGGQPVWVSGPQWPLSGSTGNPMKFVCQIALTPDLFPGAAGKMAYIFIADEGAFIDGTEEADGGENAVVIQPGRAGVPVSAIAAGPSLTKMVGRAGERRLVAEPREYAVRLEFAEEPGFRSEAEQEAWSADQCGRYANALEGNKIGGSPLFLQGDSFPTPGEWRLLLQLDSTKIPFDINFGDAGVGYAFIDRHGTMGRFLWQC